MIAEGSGLQLTSQPTMDTYHRAILSMLSSLRFSSLIRQATFFMAWYTAFAVFANHCKVAVNFNHVTERGHMKQHAPP